MDFIDHFLDCLCRTCLNVVEASSDGNNTRPQQQWQSIFDRIEECGALRITELLSTAVPQIEMLQSDELPKKICCKCLQDLLSVYRFQQMCVQSEERMRERVSKQRTDLKMSMEAAVKECELRTKDTDSSTVKSVPSSSTQKNLEHSSAPEPLYEILDQMAEAELVQSSSLGNINKLLEACKDEKGFFNEFIKNEPPKDSVDTMHATISELSMEYDEEQINVTTDESIEPEAAETTAVEHSDSIDQLLQHCKDSRGELVERIKNEPIEDVESNIDYSVGEIINSTISMLKDEVQLIESEEQQVNVISPQHHHEKKDNSDACGKKPNIRSNLIHSAILKKHACALCDKSFKTAIALKRHARTHIGNRPQCEESSSTSWHDGDKPFECPYCPQKFRSKQSMIRHQQIHKGVKREVCEICGKKIRKMNLNKHKLLHTSENPHKCDVCEKRFIRIDQLRSHMRTHTGDKPYKCKYCKLAYTTSSALTQHLRHHLGENIFRCDFCPLAFPLASKLRSHFTTHKNEDPKTRERNMKALKEEESKLRLQICKKNTQKPITTKKTEQPSKKKLQLQLEIKSTEHDGDKPYECPYCPQRFCFKQSRIRHQQIHKGVKREACDICGKNMRKGDLKQT